MPSSKEMTLLYRAVNVLKTADEINQMDDIPTALQKGLEQFPVEWWVWQMRQYPLFEEVSSFEAACAQFRKLCDGSRTVPENMDTTNGFLCSVSHLLTAWVENLQANEEIRIDGNVVFVSASHDKPGKFVVWNYDFSAVDAGDADEPEDNTLMIL